MASIIKKPPVKAADLTYDELVCTDEHKACIREIISSMAETSLVGLYFKETHLKALGDQINEVHPLKFLSVIFTDPYLKTCMTVIWDSNIKRGHFLEGLGGHLDRELAKGKLYSHLEAFGQDVGVPHEQMRPYFDARDWENFVVFLMQS
ncbi:MAG TPA: hypothetical protein VLF94_03410 [Chlamydiales bacterium]|nr:hypothetical protein [Chlamydiales bacterium]